VDRAAVVAASRVEAEEDVAGAARPRMPRRLAMRRHPRRNCRKWLWS
jgi:hypothetical protein